MKNVKSQPNMKLGDIQDVVHEKYTINISVEKASRTRDMAQEYVDGDLYTTVQFVAGVLKGVKEV